MNELTPAPTPTRLLKSLAFVARWTLTLLLLAWLLFAASWGVLHLWIVPRIGELRPQLEAAATRLVGLPVRVDSISAYSNNLLPAFELGNVRLFDDQGREALRLPRILVSLSPRSLLKLQFDQILLDSPVLNVRRSPDGRIWVAGLDLSHGHQETDEALLDRIFSQPEFVIRHGSIVWTDELRAVPPLELSAVDMVLRNRARMHEMRLDATPSVQWGDRFQLMARFEQPFLSMGNGRWRDWSGQAFADFSRVDVAQLKQYADPGVDIDQGHGAIRAWVDIQRGQVTAATADLALVQVAVRLDQTLEPLRLATVSGRLSGRFAPDGRAFATRDLAFETQDGIRWPGGNLSLRQQLAVDGKPASGVLQADRLDLTALAQIAERVPLDAALRQALARHQPAGLVETIRAQWQQPIGKDATYQVDGQVQGLAIRAVPDTTGAPAGSARSIGTPGVKGLQGNFSFNQAGGKANLTMADGSIDFPGVFEESVVPFKRLSGELSWQRRGDNLQVQLARAQFSNTDADGVLDLKWHTSDPAQSASRSRFPGVLDMQGKLSRANATRVHRYLPLVLGSDARHYVRDAVQAGAASAVAFKVKGDLWDMPFADARRGEFLITAQIADATLAYVPRSLQSADARPWPAATRLSGELVIDRQSLKVKGARGSLVGVPTLQVARADAVIADLTHHSVVEVSLEADGPLGDMLGFVASSPVATMTEQAMAGLSGSGNAQLRLKLEVPLEDADQTRVHGTVVLQGNDLQVASGVPRLQRARGTVGFTETGFSVDGVQGRFLGGDVRIDGGSQAPVAATGAQATESPALAFRLQGTVSADGLRQARELGFVSRLATRLSGSTSYSANIGMRQGEPEIVVSSTLAGMALDLPAPLGKSAEQTMPLHLESLPVREAAALRQDQLLLELGGVASVRYLRDLSGAEPRVLRGAIAVGIGVTEATLLPREGVVANLLFDTVDVDAWELLMTQVGGAAAASPPSGADAAGSYWPSSLALRARSISAGGRTLNDLVAGGSREGSVWRANLEAQQLNGYVEYRQPTGPGAGRLYARLARLTLAPSSASEVESLLDDQPQSIPALDIVVEDLELRGKKLGRVEVEAVNRAVDGSGTGGREWRLNRFDVITPEAVLRATGNWAAIRAQYADGASVVTPAQRGKRGVQQRRTVMNFRLDIKNSGELLARFGTKDVVRRGNGLMQGQVSWVGSPLSLDYASLSGAFNVNVENGQFLKADPGLAKLLGVLSLQSLPRRLTLDFRDVFSEGFAFDFFRGDVRIEQGIAYTDNLQMKGINAAVLMEGQADLFRETQDIRVLVVPEINAGTASLIAAAINPAIGLGTFLAQVILRKPLMAAATQEFHIDGSWIDPQIQRVRAKPPANATDAAPPGASSR